jgi:drug/metabolite transporter (DMT)-like permease
LGFKLHQINGWRIAGGVLIVAGVYLILKNWFYHAHHFFSSTNVL